MEKTSLNVLAFKALAALLPDARFIHVVRDGRDVAHSLMDRDWRDRDGRPFPHVTDPGAALTYWSRLVTAGLQAEARIGPERMFRLRYEDLVARPRTTLTALTGFLGLDYEFAMLDYARRPVTLTDMETESLPWLNRPLTKRRMGRGAGMAVGQEAERLLERLGYSTVAGNTKTRA